MKVVGCAGSAGKRAALVGIRWWSRGRREAAFLRSATGRRRERTIRGFPEQVNPESRRHAPRAVRCFGFSGFSLERLTIVAVAGHSPPAATGLMARHERS